MIISRESRKSRKIIHRYRSYVAVRMANASEMMRFRVICEIRVRQKSCVKREYFYNAYSLVHPVQKRTSGICAISNGTNTESAVYAIFLTLSSPLQSTNFVSC